MNEPNEITVFGSLNRISEDHEGECKITFIIPLTDLKSVLKLGEWVQSTLQITVKKN